MEEQVAAAPPQMKLKINKLTVDDVKAAFSAGFADFRSVPMFGLFFGAIYAVGGIFITIALTYFHQPWMIIPVAIGFPLVGPFIAVGLYEVSRRRERGENITWSAVLREVFRQRERQLSWMAFVVLFIFWIWVYQVRLLMALFLGFRIPASLEGFATLALTTPDGLLFLAVGTVVGAVIATILFTITVISMPLLLDHDLDFITAMLTSVKAVAENLLPMIVFGVVVALSALVSLVPAFMGLLLVLPIAGHATWHLYRRTISAI